MAEKLDPIDFSKIDEMEPDEAKRELKKRIFDKVNKSELIKHIADEFDLDPEDYSHNTFNMSGLEKIYLQATGEFDSL